MKCVGLQYLEAIPKLKNSGFVPVRDVYLSFVPDEEIGGHDGAEKFVQSEVFDEMNAGIVLDKGLATPGEEYRCPWWMVIKAVGAPGHGAKLYDNTAMENLMKSFDSVRRFRAAQFDLVKDEGEVFSVNMAFWKAGTPSPIEILAGLLVSRINEVNSGLGFVMNLRLEAQAGFDIRVPPTADQAALDKRITEEWAPASCNMTFEFKHKVSVYDKSGKPIFTASDDNWIFSYAQHPFYFTTTMSPIVVQILTDAIFLNKDEYLKGINIYASIIKTYASFVEQASDGASRDEL
ncbi:hypothetical protein LguiA_027736 [Lonicera macranthoides]